MKWQEYYSLGRNELVALVAKERARGWRPDVLSCFWDGKEARFMAVMVENPQKLEWEFDHGLSQEAYEKARAAREQSGWHPAEVLSYTVDSAVRYAALWRK